MNENTKRSPDWVAWFSDFSEAMQKTFLPPPKPAPPQKPKAFAKRGTGGWKRVQA